MAAVRRVRADMPSPCPGKRLARVAETRVGMDHPGASMGEEMSFGCIVGRVGD